MTLVARVRLRLSSCLDEDGDETEVEESQWTVMAEAPRHYGDLEWIRSIGLKEAWEACLFDPICLLGMMGGAAWPTAEIP